MKLHFPHEQIADLQRNDSALHGLLLIFARGMFLMVWLERLMPEFEIPNYFLILSEETVPGFTASHLKGRQGKNPLNLSEVLLQQVAVLTFKNSVTKVLSCLI